MKIQLSEMAASGPAADRVRFAGATLDLHTGELWRDGSRTVLPEQLFRVLAMLVQARGALVSREELRRALWANHEFGDFENGLNAAIKRLREALGDSASAPHYIETIPRRGYRLIPPIENSAAPALKPSATRRHRWAISAIGLVAAAVLAARFLPLRSAGSLASSGQELVRLTSTIGLNIDPAISPDGSLVAYASDNDSTTGLDIWVQPVAGGTPTRITSDEGDETEPSFSPDGGSIVYAKRESGGIFTVPVAGGHSRRLVEAARARTPHVSPDGRWVAYWTGQPIWNLSGAVPHANGTLEIVPAGGGLPRPIAGNFASARYGIFSADSRQVLFLGERDPSDATGAFDWYVAPVDGGVPVRTGALAVLAAAGVAGTPVPGSWARDDTVIFASVGEGASNVWQVHISHETGTIVGAPQRLTLGTAIERSPTGTPSGGIAFASLVENVDVWRTALDPTSGLASGPLERITDNAARDRVMNVSDDGRLMTFLSSRSGRDTAWIRDLGAGREWEVATDEAAGARINHGGTVVAIDQDVTRPGYGVLMAVGEKVSPLCHDCLVSDWSPDDRHVLLERGGSTELLIRDLQSGHEAPLTRHPEWKLYQGRFSPDARWVTFHSTNAPSLRQIFVVPVRGEPVPISDWIPVVTDFGIQPRWSPDGHAIYHFSFRDGAYCAWLQPLDPETMHPSGPPRAVLHLHQPRLRAVTGAIVTNDVRGGYLYVTLTETTGNVWMMTPRNKG